MITINGKRKSCLWEVHFLFNTLSCGMNLYSKTEMGPFRKTRKQRNITRATKVVKKCMNTWMKITHWWRKSLKQNQTPSKEVFCTNKMFANIKTFEEKRKQGRSQRIKPLGLTVEGPDGVIAPQIGSLNGG